MNRKIPFSKLEQTCSMCPSQWEYFENGYAAYIRYRHNKLTVYVNQTPVTKFFDCLDEKNLVLCIEELSSNPKDCDCGYLTSEQLFLILKKRNLLEEE